MQRPRKQQRGLYYLFEMGVYGSLHEIDAATRKSKSSEIFKMKNTKCYFVYYFISLWEKIHKITKIMCYNVEKLQVLTKLLQLL